MNKLNDDYIATKFIVLGSLVDRAVSMPFTKPTILNSSGKTIRGKLKEETRISSEINESAGLIHNVLEFLHEESKHVGSPCKEDRCDEARYLVDPAGYWWSALLDDFLSLEICLDSRPACSKQKPCDRHWVLDRLKPTTKTAAREIEKEAAHQEWTWLWSQPSLVKTVAGLPKITRPDLIAGISGSGCIVFDLKTTKNIDEYYESKEKYEDQKETFSDWRKLLKGQALVSNQSCALVVSSVNERAVWFDFDRINESR